MISPPLPSPGVGARRKGNLPRLPLSAFTPPNTGASDQFPLPPSPSTVQPQKIVDANVVLSTPDLSQWKADAGETLANRIAGVIVSLDGESLSETDKEDAQVQQIVSSSTRHGVPVVSVVLPFSLEKGLSSDLPPFSQHPSTSGPLRAFRTTFTKPSPQAAEHLHWPLEQGYTVDIDVQCDIRDGNGWEVFEDFLTQARSPNGKIVVSNILPPPDDLSLPIVKLLSHPSYQTYQSRIASLSLFSEVFIKYLPPAWGAPTPPSSAPLADGTSLDSKEKKEWKRRIKMYIGPVLEAFGFQRIIFGSSTSGSSQTQSRAADWYELARESFAELGVEQDAIDAVFFENAKKAYGST